MIYNLPPVHARIATRYDDLEAKVKYALNPPDEAVFIPQQQVALTPNLPTQTPNPLPPTPTATLPGPTDTPIPSPTPTITFTPLPVTVSLEGVVYVDQHGRWNYCGPANLTMALKFWGWPGTRDDVAAVVKPGIIDPAVEMRNKLRLVKAQEQVTESLRDYVDKTL